MKKSGGNWGCLLSAMLIMAALAVILLARGCHALQGAATAPVQAPTTGDSASIAAAAPPNQLLLKTSETYYDRVAAAAQSWNGKPDNPLQVQMLRKEGSREAMQHILTPTGDEPPADVWLSSTEELVQNLASATGSRRVNLADSSNYALFPPQPLVFLVRGRTQNAVDSFLRQDNPLPALPENRFHYSCADILKSGGGDSAARYLKWAFQRRARKNTTFSQFLEGLKARGFVARLKDSGPLAADFDADTDLTFILIHKALADREVAKGGSVHVVVPRWTVFEKPEAVVLQAGLNRHGDKAGAFLQFLKAEMHLEPVTGANSIEGVGDVQVEKREWETVFNGGQRLDKSPR